MLRATRRQAVNRQIDCAALRQGDATALPCRNERFDFDDPRSPSRYPSSSSGFAFAQGRSGRAGAIDRSELECHLRRADSGR
jgi:hypothetical protein